MSILQMVYAWKVQDISGTDKLVLLALADWANDQGLCWPSLDTLAGKSSLNVRTVSNAIKRLEQGGFIRRETEVGKGTKYWLTVKDPCAPELNTPLHEVQTTPARGADNTTKIHQKDIYKVDWPDWLPLDAWVGFVNMRNAIKKPMTARAVQNLLTKLEKMQKNQGPKREYFLFVIIIIIGIQKIKDQNYGIYIIQK